MAGPIDIIRIRFYSPHTDKNEDCERIAEYITITTKLRFASLVYKA